MWIHAPPAHKHRKRSFRTHDSRGIGQKARLLYANSTSPAREVIPRQADAAVQGSSSRKSVVISRSAASRLPVDRARRYFFEMSCSGLRSLTIPYGGEVWLDWCRNARPAARPGRSFRMGACGSSTDRTKCLIAGNARKASLDQLARVSFSFGQARDAAGSTITSQPHLAGDGGSDAAVFADLLQTSSGGFRGPSPGLGDP